ncbi:MAG: S-methyl-5-thioribose-1-phosphate isomerase [Acidobacteriota bacterium]
MSSWEPITWRGDHLRLLDQRRLPTEETDVLCRDASETATAITDMVVRGAPAIGVTAAYGLVLAAKTRAAEGGDGAALRERLQPDRRELLDSRPTAVNLRWALDRLDLILEERAADSASEAAAALESAAVALHEDDIAANRAIGRHGATVVPDEARLLTHCNAGALATAGYGTALGVVRGAVEAGKKVAVLADETRPFLQGARLTAWELMKDDIPVTVIADVAAASLMRAGEVDLVVVGADRIAANGDVANKVGTYPVAVLAREHGIPFYVAAPLSTIDPTMPDGDGIPIEERGPEEVRECFGVPVTPEGAAVRNPAFDVTPSALVKAIITDVGILEPPFTESIARAFADGD